MRAIEVQIHNFRTFSDARISLAPYSLLVGANNTGKSNFIDAIRVFYEKDAKFERDRDFPLFPTADEESWIEILFQASGEEFASLKEEYKLPDNTFRVRKYLTSTEMDDDGKLKAGIYAYTGGRLSNSRFYGAKNIQQNKLGDVVYIPEISRLEEATKLTGPSVLRDLITTVLRSVMGSSPAYQALKGAFEDFEAAVKSESTPDGRSLQNLEAEVSADLKAWGTSFQLLIHPISMDDLVKNLIGAAVNDERLNQAQQATSYGQGFQRHLVFTLIRLASRYNAPQPAAARRDFSPAFSWLLFEEPEAFLHPDQIDVLNTSLRRLSEDDGNQVLIATHSPQFASLNIDELPSIAHLSKNGSESAVHQVSKQQLQKVLAANQEDFAKWQDADIHIAEEDLQIQMESIKYALWLSPLRCHALFANRVLLVEGPTESALFNRMLAEGEIEACEGGVFVFDCIGKYNIHRFMNLFGALGISHGVLYDHDSGSPKHIALEETIRACRNEFTVGLDCFEVDLETFLGVPCCAKKDSKPQHLIWHLEQGKIEHERIRALAAKVSALLGS